MDYLLPLVQLEPGQRAQVTQLMGMPDQVHRLEELGLRAGSTVEMVQSGSPCIIRLDGTKLCFRESEAFSVLVKSGDGS
ncbi:MAG: FeoA family protein [Pirellulales bacterium]